jgi:hypothetical protein
MTPILRILAVIIVIMLGTYYCMTVTSEKITETFEGAQSNDRSPTCPDVLIQKDGKIVLFASKLQKVPGVNPLVFDNLEDYVEFTKWQRSNGITCPVLYLQSTHNAQGGTEYRARPDIEDPQGGLAPSIPGYKPIDLTQLDGVNDAPYFKHGGGGITGERALNTGPETMGYVNAGPSVPEGDLQGMTQSAFYQGTVTPMDDQLAKQKALNKSPSAMDASWGGKDYTNSLIDAGAYAGRTRKNM